MNESQLSSYIEEILKSKKLKEGTCGYSQDGDIDPENTDKLTPAGSSIQEALSPEVLKRAELIKNTIVGKNRDKIVKKYGPEAEKVIHGRAITQAKNQIKKEKGEDTEEEIEEVYSEKQRKWACAQDEPKFDEMCKDTAISKKKLQEDIIEKTDFVLPRGKKMILQAEDEDYNRGLIVELTNEGGYKMNYWYGDDAEVYPVEVLVDGQEIKPDAKEVYMKFHPELKENKTMANTRLQELIKSALMKETSTDKYDDNPALKGKQSELPDGLQKAIIKKSVSEDLDIGHEDNEPGMIKAELYHIGTYAMELYKIMDDLEDMGEVDFPAWWQSKITTAKNMISGAKHYLEFELKEPEIDAIVDMATNESFDSLVKKVDKSKGYTKGEAEKVAGSIAAKKRAGAGKGPTAKQKKRMAETILKELRSNINEAEVSPQIAADKAIKTLATKLEKAPEMDKLAAQVAKNPKLMAQLEKSVKDAGVNVELAEDESGLDMSDMKTMALNLAKKSKSVNEKQEYLDDDDGSVDVGLAMASFVGGGSLGAAFGSTILAAVPAVASVFAGPALVGALAGVALFTLVKKAYLADKNAGLYEVKIK